MEASVSGIKRQAKGEVPVTRRTTIALLALCTMLIPVIAVLAQGGSGPKAVAVQPIKEFDMIPKGEKISHAFEIRNEGTSTLELTNVRPACGCTIADYDKTIPPGKVGLVRTKLETANFTGPISKSIAVFTNDPENPKLQLVIKATVKPYIGVEPGFARFIYVQGEEVRPITQTIWSEDGSDFKIVEAKPPFDYLTAKIHEAKPEERKADKPGRQWRVELHLDPNAEVGPLSKYLDVTVSHPKQQVVKIPVSGFVRPRQWVTPASLDFGQLEGDALPYKRTLAFTNFITAGIQLTDVDTGSEALTAEVRETGQNDGHRFQVMVTVGPEMPKGPFSAVLKIHTTDKENPVVEVPVKGTVI